MSATNRVRENFTYDSDKIILDEILKFFPLNDLASGERWMEILGVDNLTKAFYKLT